MAGQVINIDDVPVGKITGREIRDIYNKENTGEAGLSLRVTDVMPGETTYPAHIHRENEEIIFILSGTGDIKIGDTVFPLKPNDAIFIPGGESHIIRNTGDDAMRMVCTFSTCDMAADLESDDSLDF